MTGRKTGRGRSRGGSALLRGVNAVGRGLERLGLSPVRLDESALLAAAQRSTGLDDYGDGAFREPLRRLLADWEQEARLSLAGRVIVQRDVQRTLENRLRLVADRAAHPEIAEQEIARPLFVLGLPRTGTTILHELLAQDPAVRVPLTWEVMWPSPPPERAHLHDDPRIARAASQLAAVDKLIPDFKKMHPMGAELPQECCMLTNHDFMSMQWHTSFRVPRYEDWFEAQDTRWVYASHRRQLQHLQWRHPAARWVLKSPQHLWTLDALLDVYPDACVVQTHRDPVRVLASLASLCSFLRGMASDEVDPVEVGADWAGRLCEGLERTMEVRARPGVKPEQFHDLQFRDFMRDPLAAIEGIYAHFGWELSSEARQRMAAFLAEHGAEEHGRHAYRLEDAGLDAARERERFARYQEHHGIPSEPL